MTMEIGNQHEKGDEAVWYALFSNCNAGGPIPRWSRDLSIRRLRQGRRRGDIEVLDRNSAAQAFAALLARRRFGRTAGARYVQPDGALRDRAGGAYCVHIYRHGQNGTYTDEQVRFLVVDEAE